jgi:urease accessory protein UreF
MQSVTRPPSLHCAEASAAAIRGDASALAAQLGAPDLFDLVRVGEITKIRSLASLRAFVTSFLADILEADEWPAIRKAYELTAAGHAHELLALDREWGQGLRRRGKAVAKASLRVGQRQLNKLRPLRDHRVVQRYLAAVASGEASGWHPIVYGVMLAAFGLPLRQGLIHYATRTLRGFIEPVPTGLQLSDGQKAAVLMDAESTLPEAMNRVLALGGIVPLRVV